MKHLYIILALCLLTSCNSEFKREIERTSIKTEIVTDSIYTRMPGTLLKTEKYVVWQDPFETDGFVHVVDTEIKNEIGVIGKIGQGPKEFNTPAVEKGSHNSVLVSDLNSGKQALFSLDSVAPQKNYYIELPNSTNYAAITRKIQLSDSSIISLIPGATSHPFIIEKKGALREFGSFPFEETIKNGYNVYQGNIAYNEDRNLLIYSLMNFFHIAIYERINEFDFILKNKNRPEVIYSLSESNLILDKNNKRGPGEMALTKDYIVTIQRDLSVDKTDESSVGMDYSKNATTVFLYDYRGELIRIVDLGLPLVRIAGDTQNNELYAIGVDPEFVMVKCTL